jgi:hypothetical protein
MASGELRIRPLVVGFQPLVLAVSVLCGLLVLTGCGRALTVHQDPYINTACHANRPPDKRTGEPLELDIVCVYPHDLDKPENDLLKPTSKITSKDWFERRPQTPNPEAGRFTLPKKQIFLFTGDSKAFGQKIGEYLRGAKQDGEKPVKKSGIMFDGGWGGAQFHDERSVIYIFGRFTDKDGNVLPVPPAKFHPPGAYTEQLEIKIGVDPNRPLEAAQYIEVLSPRKLHKSEAD